MTNLAADDPNRALYVGLGSNLGDRLASLSAAVRELAATPGIAVTGVSGVFETEPWGVTDQPRFLNAAVRCTTALGPFALLDAVKSIEQRLGRVPSARWGPRAVDLDLLVLGDVWLRSPTLNIPHIHLPVRAFVLATLVDLEPNLRLPGAVSAAERLAATGDAATVAPRGRLLDDWLQSRGNE